MSNLRLLVRDKNGLNINEFDFLGNKVGEKTLSPGSSPKLSRFSSDGRKAVNLYASNIHILELEGNKDEWDIQINALDFAISPKGNYLAVFTKPPSSAQDESPNVFFWRLENFGKTQKIAAFNHRHQQSWMPQWTEDESVFGRLSSQQNEVQFYRMDGAQQSSVKIREEGLSTLSIAPGPYPKVATFIREAKGEPASVKIYLLPNTTSPIAEKHFFKADKIELKWSPTGKHLLALSHTEVDATGQSYYGENNLYFISGDGSFDCRVALDKAGPVHDIAWGPRGDEFIVAYGFMPSRIALFNLKCEVAFQFPVESKNHIRYSPAGNLLAFGGFGNLPGNIEVWTRTGTQLKRVALIQAPSSSICEWSPSGHAILTGIVTPRLRVDNGFTLWSWQGKLLEKVPYTELYQVLWRPCPAGVKFPLVDFSKSAQLDFAANSALPKKEAYRPPGLRNTNVSSPGLKGDCKNDSKPVVAVQMATISSGLSNREKNIRRLEQKLEQIRQLKAKQADGLSLELNQMEKIKSEVDVKRELEHFKGMKE